MRSRNPVRVLDSSLFDHLGPAGDRPRLGGLAPARLSVAMKKEKENIKRGGEEAALSIPD